MERERENYTLWDVTTAQMEEHHQQCLAAQDANPEPNSVPIQMKEYK